MAEPRRASLLDAVAILAFVVLATLLALRTGLRPREPLAAVAVVFAPCTSTQDAILRAAAAGGRVLDAGALSSIVVVSPSAPDYADRILADGALFVLDPRVLAWCAPALSPPAVEFPMTDLSSFQRLIALALIALAFVHVPLLAAIAWALGRETWTIALAALGCACVPALMYKLHRPVWIVGMTLAVALVAQTSLLVFALTGHPWQVEMHFYYFAVLAMLSGFCDWRVLVLAAALVALHHLSLDYILPNAVYPGASDLSRVAVHAIVVVIETAMLIFIGREIIAAFRVASDARHESERLAQDLNRLIREREGDLSRTVSRANALAAAVDGFQAEVGQALRVLQDAAGELRGNAADLSAVAAQAHQRTADAASASEETRVIVTALAQAGAELAETIAAIGTSAARSSELAGKAVAQAEATNGTIADLGRLGNEIGDVIGLITGVAAQTNLLALNATIEAARAGEAGRGFSIVAQEVKALATQTAKAVSDVGSRVTAMQDATARSVVALQGITGTITDVDALARQIAGSVEQQAASTQEIAESVDKAANGASDVSGALSGIEALAEQASGAAEALTRAAAEIAAQADLFRTRVAGFASEVRAA
jgi:methyl-accepting chemotaxis protein